MGISLFRDGPRRYYRVFRSWGDETHQLYVRIHEGQDSEARQEAETLDQQLAQRQTAFFEAQPRPPQYFLPDGRLVGVRIQHSHRPGRNLELCFKLRINVPGQKIFFRSVSILEHGLTGAFVRVIEILCQLHSIDNASPLAAQMLEAAELYQLTPYQQSLLSIYQQSRSDKAEPGATRTALAPVGSSEPIEIQPRSVQPPVPPAQSLDRSQAPGVESAPIEVERPLLKLKKKPGRPPKAVREPSAAPAKPPAAPRQDAASPSARSGNGSADKYGHRTSWSGTRKVVPLKDTGPIASPAAKQEDLSDWASAMEREAQEFMKRRHVIKG